jgi:hypothetical protein
MLVDRYLIHHILFAESKQKLINKFRRLTLSKPNKYGKNGYVVDYFRVTGGSGNSFFQVFD